MIPQLLPGWWAFRHPPYFAPATIQSLGYAAPSRTLDYTAPPRRLDFTPDERRLDYAVPRNR